jgi:hypothetical protein
MVGKLQLKTLPSVLPAHQPVMFVQQVSGSLPSVDEAVSISVCDVKLQSK